MKNGFLKYAEKVIFPPRCGGCRILLPLDDENGEGVLCRECRSGFEMAKINNCPQCGREMMDCRCMPELLARAGCDGVLRLAGYRAVNVGNTVNRIVNNIKRYREPAVFEFLAKQLMPIIRRCLAESGTEDGEVCVTYCPRGHRARREYGFDQSQILAQQIALAGVFEFAKTLRRKRLVGRKSQKSLDVQDRLRNAESSVELTDTDVRGRVVLLVDDVITTGATSAACTRLLKSSGAKSVICVCIASAVHNFM